MRLTTYVRTPQPGKVLDGMCASQQNSWYGLSKGCCDLWAWVVKKYSYYYFILLYTWILFQLPFGALNRITSFPTPIGHQNMPYNNTQVQLQHAFQFRKAVSIVIRLLFFRLIGWVSISGSCSPQHNPFPPNILDRITG